LYEFEGQAQASQSLHSLKKQGALPPYKEAASLISVLMCPHRVAFRDIAVEVVHEK
jgi:hypothetical protein